MNVDIVRAPQPVRPPLQQRSRAGWERILDVGLTLLEEGGYEALTIADVCRQARVSAPSLYARVDGRAGLFRAVYERGMASVIKTENRCFEAVDGTGRSAVEAAVETFEAHRRFLRAVTRHSASDPDLLRRGSYESRRFTQRVADALREVPARQALSLARVIYIECSFRAMYGDEFWSDVPEDREAFTARLCSIAEAMVHPPLGDVHRGN